MAQHHAIHVFLVDILLRLAQHQWQHAPYVVVVPIQALIIGPQHQHQYAYHVLVVTFLLLAQHHAANVLGTHILLVNKNHAPHVLLVPILIILAQHQHQYAYHVVLACTSQLLADFV